MIVIEFAREAEHLEIQPLDVYFISTRMKLTEQLKTRAVPRGKALVSWPLSQAVTRAHSFSCENVNNAYFYITYMISERPG